MDECLRCGSEYDPAESCPTCAARAYLELQEALVRNWEVAMELEAKAQEKGVDIDGGDTWDVPF